jgi:hypothetical protein
MITFPFPITKLYGVQTGYVDNAVKQQYDSGRVLAWQKNTVVKRKYSVSCFVTKADAALFDEWYTKTLGGNGQSFTAPRLDGISGEIVYRMDNPPTIEGQAYKEITMEWIEV